MDSDAKAHSYSADIGSDECALDSHSEAAYSNTHVATLEPYAYEYASYAYGNASYAFANTAHAYTAHAHTAHAYTAHAHGTDRMSDHEHRGYPVRLELASVHRDVHLGACLPEWQAGARVHVPAAGYHVFVQEPGEPETSPLVVAPRDRHAVVDEWPGR